MTLKQIKVLAFHYENICPLNQVKVECLDFLTLAAVCLPTGTVTSFAAGFAKIRWNIWSELVIAVITALQAGLLFLMINTDNVWLCYAAYILFRGFYQFLVPIAT